jgi:hypothetical protein
MEIMHVWASIGISQESSAWRRIGDFNLVEENYLNSAHKSVNVNEI